MAVVPQLEMRWKADGGGVEGPSLHQRIGVVATTLNLHCVDFDLEIESLATTRWFMPFIAKTSTGRWTDKHMLPGTFQIQDRKDR
jgi:hypothetical protein